MSNNKTPEDQAKEFSKFDAATDTGSDLGSYRQGLFEGYLAGYKAGQEITDQEIVDIIVDIREREAKERNKRPSLQQERHDNIWEKIKVKLVGIV